MKNILKSTVLLSLLIISFSSLAQKKSKEEKQALYEQAVAIIEAGNYKFIADWAYTQKGRQVNLMANTNYLTINGEQAKAELPYFGVVTGAAAGLGGSNTGLEFEAPITDLNIDKKDKKRRLVIKFRVRMGSEVLDCTLTVNGPEAANLVITSSARQLIRYAGKLSKE
jgi:hypothetical protein